MASQSQVIQIGTITVALMPDDDNEAKPDFVEYPAILCGDLALHAYETPEDQVQGIPDISLILCISHRRTGYKVCRARSFAHALALLPRLAALDWPEGSAQQISQDETFKEAVRSVVKECEGMVEVKGPDTP